jgi:hypothetical protein
MDAKGRPSRCLASCRGQPSNHAAALASARAKIAFLALPHFATCKRTRCRYPDGSSRRSTIRTMLRNDQRNRNAGRRLGS